MGAVAAVSWSRGAISPLRPEWVQAEHVARGAALLKEDAVSGFVFVCRGEGEGVIVVVVVVAGCPRAYLPALGCQGGMSWLRSWKEAGD